MAISKIEHVVVLMLENRSFDHLMGFFPGANGLKGDEYNLRQPFEPESPNNKRYAVGKNASFAITAGQGPGHSFKASNIQIAGSPNGPDAEHPAANVGYIMSYVNTMSSDHVTNPTDVQLGEAMQAFTPESLPAINTLARSFVLCDNWFSEVPGPTQPNRLYTHAATSVGLQYNDWQRVFDVRTVYNLLEDAGKTWGVYYADDNDVAKFSQLTAKVYDSDDEVQADRANGVKGGFFDYKTFFQKHAEAGTLPAYTFIEPAFGDSGSTKDAVNSMHAPHDVRPGDQLVAEIYAALRSNEELWNKTLFIVTFDEHGGFHDHVVPAAAPNPDGINGQESNRAPAFAFDRLGLRVPAILASPWLPAGQIVSEPYQHTSIISTVREIFGLAGPLTKRDASARSFAALLDRLDAPRTDAPASLDAAAAPEITHGDKSSPDHPANQPPDPLLQEKTEGWMNLMQSTFPDEPPPEMPKTNREAHAYIRSSVRRYSNHRAKSKQPSST
ncbi:alkaline phosphatase family protein [Polyangium aurulentum]|uniref:alkaline phosphatase family protein n=1 Tax=Polyangium aurulentum TaxID=2567896 RepID=UPI00146F7BCF|nr:alkaline phosphatase family protein [Polyangium aurulentum]UQA58373.1 alkaline phosphatase family protein [Polyangium aurulentum]